MFVQTFEKEVLMVFIPFKQEKQNAVVGVLMIVIALLFVFYMGYSLVQATRSFWETFLLD